MPRGETTNLVSKHPRRRRVRRPLDGSRLCDDASQGLDAEAAVRAFSRMQVDAMRRFNICHCLLLRHAA
jgi:hypothetical protein